MSAEAHTCEACGADLAGRRKGTKTCDATCRSRACKERKLAKGLDAYERGPTLTRTFALFDSARNVPTRSKEQTSTYFRAGVRVYVTEDEDQATVWAKVQAKRAAKRRGEIRQ
jgi:hypothetical protein